MNRPSCLECGDAGFVYEKIDDDRPAVRVVCAGCRRFCPDCNRHVPRVGHQCEVTMSQPQRDKSTAKLIVIDDLAGPFRFVATVGPETNPLTLRYAHSVVDDLNQVFAANHVRLNAKLVSTEHVAIRK